MKSPEEVDEPDFSRPQYLKAFARFLSKLPKPEYLDEHLDAGVTTMETRPFQSRSETSGLQYFDTLQQALDSAGADSSIWKISFSLPTGERVRLVRNEASWIYDPIVVTK